MGRSIDRSIDIGSINRSIDQAYRPTYIPTRNRERSTYRWTRHPMKIKQCHRNQPHIGRKSNRNRPKIEEKSIPWSVRGDLWRFGVGWGGSPDAPDTRRDAIGTLPGRSVEPPGLSGTLPRRPGTLPRRVGECLQRVFAKVRARRRFHIDFRTVF